MTLNYCVHISSSSYPTVTSFLIIARAFVPFHGQLNLPCLGWGLLNRQRLENCRVQFHCNNEWYFQLQRTAETHPEVLEMLRKKNKMITLFLVRRFLADRGKAETKWGQQEERRLWVFLYLHMGKKSAKTMFFKWARIPIPKGNARRTSIIFAVLCRGERKSIRGSSLFSLEDWRDKWLREMLSCRREEWAVVIAVKKNKSKEGNFRHGF